MGYKVISADDHIIEHRDLFATRLPMEFRDKAPRIVRGADGGDGWSWDGKAPARTLGIEATAGRATRASGFKWEDILPGNYDGGEHLKDMDKASIDAAIMFPTITLLSWSMGKSPFALAMMQCFNDWMMQDFCGADPKRLIGLPMLPVNHGIEATLTEFERCLKMGARGIHIPVFPDLPYVDRSYDPLWSAAEQANVPLCMHRTSGGNDPAGKSNFQFNVPGLNIAGSVVRFFAGVEPLTNLIFTGVFQRHPKLMVVDAEVNFGWMPFWKQTMDDCHERQKGWAKFPFDHSPGETLGKNVFVTVLDDKVGFDAVADEPWLADVALFSTDYPHSFCLWPNTFDDIERVASDLDAASKTKILAGNAIRVFGLN
ncbi:MAG: amidohydrolase family protein [Rhizomicrobium sp.]